MEYTTTISTKEFQTLVTEHTCMQIELNQVQAKLTDESWKNYQALKAVKEELEEARKDLESVKHSSDFWYGKACELGYGKENGEAE